MNHEGTQTIWIRERHIILRRFTQEDSRTMCGNWASNPEVTKYLTWSAYREVSDAETKITEWAEKYISPCFYHWAIEFYGELIGSISAKTGFISATDRAGLSYCIGKKWRNRGIVTETAKAVMDYMFSECDVHACGTLHCMDNPAAGRVAEKCGMHRDGVLPEYFKVEDETWQDVAVWNILRNEWHGREPG